MRPSTGLVAALLFGSGMAALVYQTAWQRMLRLVFGASTGASAAVLAIFLGGLGLGGVWLGRRAERNERPLFLYGNLEVGVALTAAVTPFLIDLASHLYFGLGGSRALGVGGATALRLVLALLILGPSVVLMGGTLPAAARAVESEGDAARGRLAVLYAVNTTGAVAGALLGTFALFELFGTRLALWVAVLVNLLVAIYARSVGRRAEPIPVTEDGTDKDAKATEDEPPPAPPALIYAAAAIFGFAFLFLELVWYRMLSPILGGSTFTFGLILAVALAGIGIGGYLYTLRDRSKPATLSLLAATAGLEALFVAVPLALGDQVAYLAAHGRAIPGLSFTSLVGGWSVICAIVVLPAAIVSGYQFPVLFALLGRGRKGVARQVGTAYGFNTAGSIAGSLFGGFMLIPALGAVVSWRLVVGLLVATSVASLVLAWRREGERGRGLVALATASTILGSLLVLAQGPTPVWRHSAVGAGRAQLSGLTANDLKRWSHEMRTSIRWERDGIESGVAFGFSSGASFIVNGKSDGSVQGDRATMVMATLLPAMLHGNPERVYVIGLGLGLSAGWVAKVPGVKHVDVAELEPAIIDVARDVAPSNFDVVNLPNVSIFEGDGREFLLTSTERYDLIMSEPSNPYRAGVASLFTRDFYEASAERMTDDGIFAQWIQAYEVDTTTLRIVMKTLRSVFPHVEAWTTQRGDFLFLASKGARTYDVAKLRQLAQQEPYRTALLRAWLVQDVEGVLGHFVADAQLVAEVADLEGVPINTDDENALEYAFARSVGLPGEDIILDLLAQAMARGHGRPSMQGPVDWSRVDEQRLRAWMLLERSLPALPGVRDELLQRAQAVSNGCHGAGTRVLSRWEAGKGEEPRDLVETFALALAHADVGDPQVAESLIAELDGAGLAAAASLLRAKVAVRSGDRSLAMTHLEKTFEQLRATPIPLCRTLGIALDLARRVPGTDRELVLRGARALMAGPFSVWGQERSRTKTMQDLAFRAGDPELCLKSLGHQLEIPWWNHRFLDGRRRCLEANQHPMASIAADDLLEYLSKTPGGFASGLPPPPAKEGAPVPRGDDGLGGLVKTGETIPEPASPTDAAAPDGASTEVTDGSADAALD